MTEPRTISSGRTTLALGAAVAALLLVLSGCGSHKKQAVATTTTTTVVPTTTSMPPTTTAETTVSPTSIPETSTMSHLVAVRVTAQGGGDSVSFEFDNGIPGYVLSSTTSPVKAGDSGAGVAVAGVAVTQIAFATASDVDLSGGLKTYYNGSKRFTPADAKVVSEVVQIADNEGRLTWAVGSATKTSVTVTTVASPAQVVLNFS